MSLVHGRRTIWPHTFLHWEIRRGFTVPDYSSPEWDQIVATAELEADRLGLDPAAAISDACEGTYVVSCLGLLKSRLGFYKYSMPASSYRRTSIDFKMSCSSDLNIEAKTETNHPDVINITSGIVLSLEDAAQSLLTVWERPFGLHAEPARPNAIPLRLATRGHVDAFVDYSAAFSAPKDRGSTRAAGRESIIPGLFHELFIGVSADLARQTLADHLSLISLLWVIAHEDAHKYSGHLLHFPVLNISEGGDLFNELIATSSQERYVRARRPAELEADTCATMRAVDSYFDSEFLGIITDWMPQEMRADIRRGRRESDGLDADQRLFLMRLMAVAAILPLVVFDVGICSVPDNNLSNYPPLAIRALNVVFTIASRAVDVSLQQPAYRVGQFASLELAAFFQRALEDLQAVYRIIDICIRGPDAPSLKPLWVADPELVKACFVAFLAYHGQSHLVGFNSGIPADVLQAQDDLVVALIRERHAMDLACVEQFADARKQENAARLDKAVEDINLARRRIDLARDAFDFLGACHPNLAIRPDGAGEMGPQIEAEPPRGQGPAIGEQSPRSGEPDLAPCSDQPAGRLDRVDGPGREAESACHPAPAIREAGSCLDRAPSGDFRECGPGIPDEARDLYNRGALLQARNRLEEAEPLYRIALVLCERAHCAEDPEAADILNNLAELLRGAGRPAEAEPLYHRALAINREFYGPDHPSVAIILNNLGELYRGLGRPDTAEPLYRRALAIDERALGPDHPDVAIRLSNLAQLLQDKGCLNEAESLMRRALAIDERSHGPIHADVGLDLNNLADLLRATGRLDEAQALFARAVEIFLNVTHDTGYESPQLDIAIKNYALLLYARGWTEGEVLDHLERMGRPFGYVFR